MYAYTEHQTQVGIRAKTSHQKSRNSCEYYRGTMAGSRPLNYFLHTAHTLFI